MRTYDFSPLFRSTIGFDRVSRLLDTALQTEDGAGYPPYNIEKTGDETYRIVMAVAGFGEDDLEIVANENSLVVKGHARKDEEGVTFLHRVHRRPRIRAPVGELARLHRVHSARAEMNERAELIEAYDPRDAGST